MNAEPNEPLIAEETLAELAVCKTPKDCAVPSAYGLIFRPSAVGQLAETVRQLVRVDVKRALRLAEAAVVIATELADATAMAGV
ncbi:MAG: hypothetical protein WKF37_09870 [Bryobacteraceae bacterium]